MSDPADLTLGVGKTPSDTAEGAPTGTARVGAPPAHEPAPPGHVAVRHRDYPAVADWNAPESAVPILRGSGWELAPEPSAPDPTATPGPAEESAGSPVPAPELSPRRRRRDPEEN